MPSEEIFGDEDSSDDDDDDDDAVGEKEPTTPSKDGEKKDADGDAGKSTEDKKPGEDPFAEEDTDDSDVEKKKDKKTDDSEDDDGAGKASPKKDVDKKSDDDDLDDSDDDDVEFDDSGAVTGTSHIKGFQKKDSKKKSSVDILREAEAAEEAAAREDARDPDSPRRPPPPKVDPRTMMVLESERPPSSATLHITKLPNLVGIQQEAFDPDTYSAKAEEEEFQGSAHDMIRWRYKRDKDGNMMRDEKGNLLRESNARLVQWEDGSYTLHVGKEALLVDSVDSSQTIAPMDVVTGRTATFAGLNGYLYLSQMAKYREKKKYDDDDAEEDKDGFQITPAGTVLECIGAVKSRLTARPASLRSEAHKSLTVAVRKKTIKRAQITEIVTQYDPEKMKEERIKDQDALAKEKARKRPRGDNYRSNSRPRPGMNRRYLEDDGDFDSTNLSAIRKRTMDADDEDMDDFDDGDDDDDGGTFNRKRPRKRVASKSVGSDDDEEEAPAAGGAKSDDDDDDEDDDDEVITTVKSTKKRSHQAVFDDDESD